MLWSEISIHDKESAFFTLFTTVIDERRRESDYGKPKDFFQNASEIFQRFLAKISRLNQVTKTDRPSYKQIIPQLSIKVKGT